MLTREATASQVSWAPGRSELPAPSPLVVFKALRDGCLQESLNEETGSKDSGKWLGGGRLEELEEGGGGAEQGSQEGSPREWECVVLEGKNCEDGSERWGEG